MERAHPPESTLSGAEQRSLGHETHLSERAHGPCHRTQHFPAGATARAVVAFISFALSGAPLAVSSARISVPRLLGAAPTRQGANAAVQGSALSVRASQAFLLGFVSLLQPGRPLCGCLPAQLGHMCADSESPFSSDGSEP